MKKTMWFGETSTLKSVKKEIESKLRKKSTDRVIHISAEGTFL
jgi:hypothetical protein